MYCHQTRPCKQQKSLNHTCLKLASWSRKIFPLVASSHIQSYIIIIIDLIWNCISAFYHRLSHTFSNIRNNLLKQVTQKIIQLAVISKVTSKNLSQLQNKFGYKMGNVVRGINQELRLNMHTLLYLKQITNKDLPYHTRNSTQYCVITSLRKESEKE